MVKNQRLESRLDSETMRRLHLKVSQSGCETMTEFLEKIANEPIIFLKNLRQKFKKEK